MFSINDTHLKERLLRDNALTLLKAIDVCRSAELAKTQMQAMQTPHVVQDAAVDAVKKAERRTHTGGWNKSNSSAMRKTISVCHKCGNKHEPRQCPAYGAACHKCGKNNHFSKMCKSGTDKNNNHKTKAMNNIETEVNSFIHRHDRKRR